MYTKLYLLLPFFARFVASRPIQVMVLFLFLVGSILPGHAQLPTGWAGTDIGGAASGSNTYSNGVYTITGSGTGIGGNSDQMHFTYYTYSAGGNFRLTARLASFTGTAGSEVGLTVRQGTASTGSIGAVAYQPAQASGTNPNTFTCFTRNTQTGAFYPWRQWSEQTNLGAPCWLQLVRYGNNFAVYKSTDGLFWSQVSMGSGGTFSATGAIQIGFFVSSSGSGSATATIDNVNLNLAPTLAWESSWLGNTYSSDSTSYVSASATAMWVGPDGTCYVTSLWDEGGEEGKSYKNGKVVNHFALLAGNAYEGTITSDGTFLYYFGQPNSNYNFDMVWKTDMTGGSTLQVPLYTQTPILNSNNGEMVSGIACGNGELYLSDALTNQILVLNPSQPTYGAQLTCYTGSTTQTINTSAVTNPTPQAVYQTEYLARFIPLTFPGLTPNQTYTVRLHFSENSPSDGVVGKRLMDIWINNQNLQNNYDIFATTGALYKATTLSYANITADSTGSIPVGIVADADSPDQTSTLSGVEFLNADGSAALQINCGGPAVGSWQSSIHELPNRDFPFTRPGPIAVDSAGNLWIVQEGTTFPATLNFNYTPGWAAIKLYDKNGNYLNKLITDVVDPTAVSYNAATDTLLVAENGPAQNVRIYNVYTGTGTAPALSSTLGVNGGVFAGSTPGLVYDPASGGNARFFGPTGVGEDSSGNIYVACNAGMNSTDLKAFNSSGTMLWDLSGLEFCNTGGFDLSQSLSDIWTPDHHYTMNWGNSVAGSEWSLKSFTANPFASYPMPVNPVQSNTATYRTLGTTPLVYSGQQGFLGSVTIDRFVGEQLVPCGSITGGGNGISIWIDSNGDGIQQTNEVVTANYAEPNTSLLSFDVATNGDIYLAMAGAGSPNPNVQKFSFQGLNAIGAPIYTAANSSVLAPAPFNGNWGTRARLRYVGGSLDTMYLMGETNPMAFQTDYNYGGTLACYDHWNTSPVLRFATVLPTPASTPNFVQGAPPYINDGFVYMAFDVANGTAFASDIWGTIHVVDANGSLLTNLLPGPEICGLSAWEDQNLGVRAVYNPTSQEYRILQENSGYHAKEMLYRWKSPFLLVSLASQDIGSVAVAGSSSLTNGVYTVKGDGADIWGTADAFHYDYQALSGNGTIIARVTGVSDTNVWAKAGVMIRETLTAGSREASVLMTPTTTEGGTWQWRSSTGGSSSNTDMSGIAPTYWVKLVRSGNVFTGYVSPNGVTWTQVGSPQTISMATSAYVGLAVTSRNNVSPACTATFDNVTVTSP